MNKLSDSHLAKCITAPQHKVLTALTAHFRVSHEVSDGLGIARLTDFAMTRARRALAATASFLSLSARSIVSTSTDVR